MIYDPRENIGAEQAAEEAKQQAQLEAEGAAKYEYFLKKKGIHEAHQRFVDSKKRLDEAMQEHGVTAEDVNEGLVPEEVLKLMVETNRNFVIARSTTGRAIKAAQQNGEFETFDDEFNNVKRTQNEIAIDRAAAKEAEDKYLNNPTHENELNYIRKNTLTYEEGIAKQQADREAYHQKLKEDAMANTIELNAQAEVQKQLNLEATRNRELIKRQTITESIKNDPRFRHGRTHREPNEIDKAIEERKRQLLESQKRWY